MKIRVLLFALMLDLALARQIATKPQVSSAAHLVQSPNEMPLAKIVVIPKRSSANPDIAPANPDIISLKPAPPAGPSNDIKRPAGPGWHRADPAGWIRDGDQVAGLAHVVVPEQQPGRGERHHVQPRTNAAAGSPGRASDEFAEVKETMMKANAEAYAAIKKAAIENEETIKKGAAEAEAAIKKAGAVEEEVIKKAEAEAEAASSSQKLKSGGA